MIGLKTFVTAAIVSTGAVASASAQLQEWAASEPGAFQAQYPNRDVLNGGALTPAGRMGLELPGEANPAFGPTSVYMATGTAAAFACVERLHSSASGTLRGRRHSCK